MALLASLAWLLPGVALRSARVALLDFGPNDADYVRGFRADWERDGLTRFHWTTQGANVTLPLRAIGQDLKLRLRLRRHFLEPAYVRLIVEGRTIHSFEIQADPKVPYRVLEVPLPRLQGRHPFVLSIEAPSQSDRPLGVALDWMELRCEGAGRFALLPRALVALVLVTLVGFAAPRLAGGSLRLALSHSAFLLAATGLGLALDVLAVERILREGAASYVVTAAVAVALGRWRASASWLGIDCDRVRSALVVVVLLALGLRFALLLHPRFYYPDVRIHGLFALQLARRGAVEFLRDFTENQFRLSLGLQWVNGHWYAFPYPPAFYFLAAPLIALGRYRPEIAVALTAGVVNSLQAFAVFGIGRCLGLGPGAAVLGGAVHALLPLYLARLSLAYFPALVGHAVDTLVILFLLARYEGLGRARNAVHAALLVALALLTYTQGLLNFGVLLAQFLLFDRVGDRSREARRRQLGLACAGVLAGLLAALLFYGRYLPVLVDMQRGVPMTEERILLDRLERMRPDEGAAPEEADPFSGDSFDLWRGVRKAAWRLYVFYGGFAPLVPLAVVALAVGLPGWLSRFVWAWALTYLTLNLASGGLPGPNLVRYNKDLEIVAPLVCVALAAATARAWASGRALARASAVLGCVAWVGFSLARSYGYLAERIWLER